MNHQSLLIPVFLLLVASSYALPDFVARFPNGNAVTRPGSGITCDHLGHEDCIPGARRNPFGQDFDDNGRKWDKALCEKDSDGDGLTNGEELGDPCCLWSADNPTELREDQLSHPGDVTDDAAKSAPTCPPSPKPSPAGNGETSPTGAPTTGAPTTGAPTTGAPTTGAPTTGAPTTEAPTTEAPTTEAPTTEAPTTEAPTTNEPTNDTPTPTDDDDNGVCFPAHATVQLENGVIKRMDQLQIGDRVHIGRGKYSDVFLFTHKIPDVDHEFVTIRAGTEDKLDALVTLTKGHFIYASGHLVTADQVKIGDMLELDDGSMSPVIEIECATFKGLYNPQTNHGDMVVNGVKVSTYTKAVQTGIAHSLLAPLRAVYRWVGWSTRSLERGAPRMAKILP